MKKFLFILSLYFFWFIYSFYTLDYSSGSPMVTNLSLITLFLLVMYSIYSFIRFLFHKKTP